MHTNNRRFLAEAKKDLELAVIKSLCRAPLSPDELHELLSVAESDLIRDYGCDLYMAETVKQHAKQEQFRLRSQNQNTPHEDLTDLYPDKPYTRTSPINELSGVKHRLSVARQQIRRVIREQVQTWAERQAEMDAWEKKLAATLPKDPSDLSKADHKKVALVFIDEYGLDQADAFFEDDTNTLAGLGVQRDDLNLVGYAITHAQNKALQANIAASPNKKELEAIGGSYGPVEPREVEYLTYQPIRKGGKVVAFQIEDSETPWGTMPLGHSTFTVNDAWAKQHGTTIDKIISVLEKGGATLRKKRKPIKHSPVQYD